MTLSPTPAPGDYEELNTQLVFGVGSSTGAVACADFLVIDDNVVEESEEALTLTMTAHDPPVTTTTTVSATVIIRENNNDGISKVYFILYGTVPNHIKINFLKFFIQHMRIKLSMP